MPLARSTVTSEFRAESPLGPIATIPSRLVRSVRRNGLSGFLRNAGRRARDYVYKSKTISIVVLPLATFEPHYQGRRSYCEVIRPEAADLDRYSHPELAPFVESIRRWLERGDYFFLAVKGGAPIGFIDLMRETLEDDEGLRVELSGDECQVRNVQLFRAHRNTVAGGLLFDAALSFARSRGLRRNVGSVDCRNVPSLRIAHHIGYLEVERVTCRRLLYHLRWRRVVWRAASREEGREITWDSANPPLSRRARARGGLRRRDGR